jgi:hypothetical protein
MVRSRKIVALCTAVLAAGVVVFADHLGFTGPSYPVSGAPRAVVAADLNGDGKTDFASADMGSDSVSLYGGDGTGEFLSWGALPLGAGAGPFALAAADLDLDGLLDLVVANADNDRIAIFFGGHGILPGDRRKDEVAVSGSPRGVAAVDVNRDGKVDLAVTGASCSCVALLRNSGGASFTLVGRVQTSSQPHGIVVGDFNRDDIPDLAIASPAEGSIDVLTGDGRFGFTAQPYGPAPGTRALVVVDADRDGWLDVIAANTTTSADQPIISVFRNHAGVLRYQPSGLEVEGRPPADRRGIAVINTNGDGWPDLAVSVRNGERVEYFMGRGGAQFFGGGDSTETLRTPLMGPRGLAIADVNEDGRPDIVVGNEFGGSVSVLRNISEWTTDSP